MDEKIRGEKHTIAAYKTLAMADNIKKAEKTNMGIPSQTGVKEGKDWVDENQK